MGYRLVPLYLVVVLGGALGGCGKEIGDSCTLNSDCSPNGDRICIDSDEQHGGYCTVQGCDYSTCPDEAACIRFFSGSFANKTCDPTKPADACRMDPVNCCSLDELCAIDGHCVARSSEVRYCMRTCGSDDDCRDAYECRNLDLMKAHGGQPVLAPVKGPDDQLVDAPIDDKAPKFCAKKPDVATP